MSKSSSADPHWDQLREKVIGLGERSFRKSYYPQLLQQIQALEVERRKAEANEHKFRTLFEHISDGIVLVDIETRVLILGNQAIAQMTGYSQDELQGRAISDIVPMEETPWLREEFAKQVRGEIKIVRDVPVKRRDGSVFYADVNAAPVYLDGRRLYMGVVRDVTERRASESALENAYLDTVLALSRMMDARDAYTGTHSQNLAAWARAVAERLGCSQGEIRTIHWAALLHDIGKTGVPDEILRKPESLTAEEWRIMKRHPEIGAAIVAPIKQLNGVAEIIRTHHEKFDGSGYPDGLIGETIPLGGRILSVVDCYSAMTDERIYRSARTHAEAVAELRVCSGVAFDPQIVQIFLQMLGAG
ncbi:MAG: PAS domain S-box protein [Chloroflexi bacterium]|nr:PAS domain S-box protein [Chloroflexota bacterium]